MINGKIINDVADAVKKQLPKDIKKEVTVKVEKIIKGNDLVLHGIVIRNKNDNFAPTIYLENYCNLLENDVPLEAVANIIISDYKTCMENVPVNVGLIAKPDFSIDKILDKLEVQLVNKRMNKMRLNTAVYGNAGDEFALLVYIVVTEANGESYKTVLKKEFMENTELTEEEVVEIALKNTEKKRRPVFSKIVDIFDSDDDSEIYPLTDETTFSDMKDLFLLTNTDMHFGATAFYYPGVMELIGKKLNQNYYAVPSSVDEFLIIPEELNFPESALKTMLADGNEVTIDVDEYLSDNVFKYDIGQGELTRVEVSA